MPPRDITYRWLLLLLLFSSACSRSAGPELAPVWGSVLLDGEPLSLGSIQFLPREGTPGPAASAAIEEGRFQISHPEGLLPGTYRVEIERTDHLDFDITDDQAFASAGPPGPNRPQRLFLRIPVPDVAISAGQDTPLVFDLRSPVPKPRSFR